MSTVPASVLLVTPRWTRDGGVATHVTASAEALARAGVAVSVLAAKVISDESAPGMRVHRSPSLFDAGASAQERFGAALQSRPDVIHLHQVDDPEIVTALKASAPLVISAHGYSACSSGVYYFDPGQECTRGHGPACMSNMLLRGCAHTRHLHTLPARYGNASRGLAALRAADLVLAYSKAVDRHLAANGLSRRGIVPLFSTVTAQHGSGHEARRRVVFAGRVVNAKGVDVLIHAAREVDGEFVICGDGHELAQMRRLTAKLGIADRVSFKGWLDADELAREFAEASVVAVPSRWPEPFGLVGIEALAAGRPVVASATGGILEWLEPGVSGLAVPAGDAGALAGALTELLGEPERQRQMGEAGKLAVERDFTAERHVAVLLDAYAAAIAGRERHRVTSIPPGADGP